MATEFQKYIVQAEHNLRVMRNCLMGERDKDKPGIIDFNSQMVDIYMRWYNYTESHKTNIVGGSKVSDFIKNQKLDFFEISKLFMLRYTCYDSSAVRLAEVFERLMQEGDKLSSKKKKVLYSARGAKYEIYKDIMYDLSGLCYRNDKFLDAADDMAKLIEKRPNNNDIVENGRIIVPLTDVQQKRLDDIEEKYYDMLHTYNEYAIDDQGRLEPLYMAVRKLITEKLSKYANIKWDARDTVFPNKAYVIPKKYVKKEEFNPYYVSKKRHSRDILDNLPSDEYLY